MESIEVQEQQELSSLQNSQLPHGGKLAPPKENTREKKLVKAAAGFFALMIVLTFLSRSADSMTVPVVVTQAPQSTFLNHDISIVGTVRANKERAIVTDQGILIADVPVREGQSVKAGDPLVILDQGDLKDKMTDISLELQKLQLQAGNNEEKNQQSIADIDYSVQKAEGEVTRAEEDLQRITEEADSAIKRAREDLDDTLERWSNAGQEHLDEILYGERDEDYEDEKENFVNPYETEYRASRRTLKDARDKKDRDIIAAERVIEDKKQAVEDAKRKLNAPKEASAIYIDIQQKNRDIAKLNQYQKTGGVVAAEFDGTITEVKVKSGQRTTGETILTMAEETSGFKFEAELNEEQMKYVGLGDDVRITFPGSQTPTIAKIDILNVKSDDGTSNAHISAQLPPEVGSIGMAATMDVSKKTQNYSTCIPISALREDNVGKFVLVVEERESVLGLEMVAVRVPVRVLDKTAARAAVDGTLYKDSKIIVSSEKQIAEGDRVRLGV